MKKLKMYCLAVISCLLAVALAGPFSAELDSEWGAYKATYNKNYLTEIEPFRRTIWEKNVHKVRQHNREADRGLHTYRLGMNEYGDLTSEEFVTQMLGLKRNQSNSGICKQYQTPLNVELSDLPKEVDWRKKGYVTGVKNQGQCGSCWAFSAVGSLEGQHFRKCGKLVSLSEQNLVDCSNKYGNHGCQGGLMDQAFKYIIKNKGIDTEQSYPYRAKNGKCHFKRSGVGATMTRCMDIKTESEADLQKAVATVGPISVAIDAGHLSFQLYSSGVYTETECSQTTLDHGVLAVGYGCQGGKDYWLVKNSWGTSWGMNGYIMMARNHNNMCGIATMASFPVV